MDRATAESIIDAYCWSVELMSESEDELSDSAKVKANGLYDALRDFLILTLSEKVVDE